MNVDSYLQIMDKVKYLVKVTRANFTQKDEQIMFVANQLSEYVEYDFEAAKRSKNSPKYENSQEYKEISSLKGCLQNRKTLCSGVAFAFERCMHELGTECMLIMGALYQDKGSKKLTSLDNNHVWNKIKLNNEWHNVDVTNILPRPNPQNTKEELVNAYILSSDSSFEKIGCKIMDMRGIPVSNTNYANKMAVYEKTKNIVNVLEEYDKGKRTTFISYKNVQSPNAHLEQQADLDRSYKRDMKKEDFMI